MYSAQEKIVKKGPESLSFWLFLIPLFALVNYNTQNSGLRMVLVLGIMFLPIFYLYRSPLSKNFHCSFFISIFIIIYLLTCLAINSNTLEFNISGPNAEIFAAFVGFSFVFYVEMIKSQKINKLDVRHLFMFFVLGWLGILLADLLTRYLEEPECFLNYFCRKSAKTVGFFSTTNVTGVNIATILITLLATKQAKYFKLTFILFNVILFTTMARAAIISYIFVTLAYIIFQSNIFVKFSTLLIFIFSIIGIAVYNPYNILNDGSLLSKFEFINQTILLAEDAGLRELFFGYGASLDSVASILGVNGWSPHLPLLKAFLYFGLPGVIFYIISILVPVFVVGRTFFWPLLVNQLAAMAGGPMYSSTLTCALILVYMVQVNNKRIPFNG